MTNDLQTLKRKYLQR